MYFITVHTACRWEFVTGVAAVNVTVTDPLSCQTEPVTEHLAGTALGNTWGRGTYTLLHKELGLPQISVKLNYIYI